MGVYQYEIPGVIELENGAREAVVIHLYLKGLQNGDTVTYRGSMFAESAEWEWYNWGGTGLCQPQITANWWPRVYFRCAGEASTQGSMSHPCVYVNDNLSSSSGTVKGYAIRTPGMDGSPGAP